MKRMTMIFLPAMAFSLGCNQQQQEVPKPQPAITQGQSQKATDGSVAGIVWSVPSRWGQQPQRQMRVATYDVPSMKGDGNSGECAVFFFGKGQGGGVDANIDRWVGQFENAEGPKRSTKTINGMEVTLVEIAGTYLAPGGPAMQSQGKLENYRLLGGIVNAPDGGVFFKFVGPATTVAEAENEFGEMIGSIAQQ